MVKSREESFWVENVMTEYRALIWYGITTTTIITIYTKILNMKISFKSYFSPDVAIEQSPHQLRIQEVMGSNVSSLTDCPDFGDLGVYWRLMLNLIFRNTSLGLWIELLKIKSSSGPF
jgi:hypothetical protein